MSLKNIWRLRFFINRYSPSDKKKRYMNNKLDELEEQIEKMRCCNNCKNAHYDWRDQIFEGACTKCKKYNKWELAE